MGIVEQIYIAADRRDPVVPLSEAILEKDKGIVGDRYYFAAETTLAQGEEAPGDQVTLIDADLLDLFLNEHSEQLSYGDFRRSIVTRGIDLNELIDREFSIGEARCRATELCEPCAWLAQNVHAAVLPGLVHKAGIRAAVLESGKIKPGSRVTPV